MNIFLFLFIEIDKAVAIYSKFRFNYHKGKQPGMVNAHLPLKMPLSLAHYDIIKTWKVLVSHCYNIKDKFCLKISDSYL